MSRPAIAADLTVDLVDEPVVAAPPPPVAACDVCGGAGEVWTILTVNGVWIPPVGTTRRIARLDPCPGCGGTGDRS